MGHQHRRKRELLPFLITAPSNGDSSLPWVGSQRRSIKVATALTHPMEIAGNSFAIGVSLADKALYQAKSSEAGYVLAGVQCYPDYTDDVLREISRTCYVLYLFN